MKISIAMALYNGESYLLEQLESLVAQSRKPDELIAFDDGSVDNTERLFQEFVQKHHLEGAWHYHKNEKNKGPMENFLCCAEACTGDVIFFSDQDDIWHKEKLERMVSVFCEYSEAEAVACGIQMIDAQGKRIKKNGRVNWQIKPKKTNLYTQVKKMRSSGLTLAITRNLLDYALPIIRRNGLTFDLSMGLIASARGTFYRLELPLVLHRIHESNASTPQIGLIQRSKHYQRHINGRILQLAHMEAICTEMNDMLTKRESYWLNKRIEQTAKSIEYLKKRDVIKLVIQCLNYNPMNYYTLNVANVALASLERMKGNNNAE